MVQHPPGRTSVCPVDRDLVRIGRHPSNDIVIDEIYVSGFHAELHRLPGGKFELVDLNSFNGTFVNCQRIQRSTLQDGDAIAFALTQAKFRLHVAKEAEAAGNAWSAAVRERGAVEPEKNGKAPFQLPQAQPAPIPAGQPVPPPVRRLTPQVGPDTAPARTPVPQRRAPLTPVSRPTPLPPPPMAGPSQEDGPKTLPLRPPLRLTPPAPTPPKENNAPGLGCGIVLRFEPDHPGENR